MINKNNFNNKIQKLKNYFKKCHHNKVKVLKKMNQLDSLADLLLIYKLELLAEVNRKWKYLAIKKS